MRTPWRWLAEQFDVSRSWMWPGDAIRGLRSLARGPGWWNEGRPLQDRTEITYDKARLLYRNQDPCLLLGAGFCRPMIDLVPEYVGIPRVTSEDDERDTFLNECIQHYWAPILLQAWRDASRDSKTILRFRRPQRANKLITDSDFLHGRIECVPPELVQIIWAPDDPELIEKAIVTHWVDIEDTSVVPETINADNVSQMQAPTVSEHQLVEVITPARIQWFDLTDSKELVSWGGPNRDGFVPLWPIYNEYDASLSGGQSDLEAMLPFIKAFHEVLTQTLSAHSYHSTPKLKFKLRDVGPFLANNFPDVIDPATGSPSAGASIKWSGREVLFLQFDEDIEFIEARSILGDSKTLLEFLIECICIVSETPKWALMKIENISDKNAEARPFEKKMERKRQSFAPAVAMVCKMALAATGRSPETVEVVWPAIRMDDLIAKGQAIEQLILGFDVATQHQWMSDDTVISILGGLFAELKAPNQEKRDAADNFQPVVPAPAPQSSTQALPPGGSKNGSGSKPAAQQALTTTKASRS